MEGIEFIKFETPTTAKQRGCRLRVRKDKLTHWGERPEIPGGHGTPGTWIRIEGEEGSLYVTMSLDALDRLMDE